MPKIVIMGSGCAGLTAAIYSARANLKPLVIEGWEAGGQLSLTTEVENFPGFPGGVQGPELIRLMREQAAKFGAEFLQGTVTEAKLSASPFVLTVDEKPIEAEALIVATGASARMLGIPAEKHLLGHGVSTCATCDGFFYRGKKVIVVGGGDTAMEEATFLTKFATEVLLVHRRDQFRASKIMLERARKNEKIKFLMDTVIDHISDQEKKSVERVWLRNVKTNEVTERDVDGVFVAIGHTPNTAFLKGQLETDADGYLKTTHGPCTSIPGVYAAGDVQDRHYRQAITASGSGCMSAIEAERWLESKAG
jgi:thioredoxin reductase (NADPH)